MLKIAHILDYLRYTYYLADYDLDSSKIVLEKGKVINDSLDVGSEVQLLSKQLKQLMLVDGITDEYEYSVGDILFFTARITNRSENTMQIRVFNGIEIMRNVFLYNDKYIGFSLTPMVVIPSEAYLTLYSGDIYMESEHFIVPAGTYINDSLFSIPNDEYIVTARNFEIIRQDLAIYNKIKRYIRFKWYSNKLLVYNSPESDLFPNKYEYPHVFIKRGFN